VLRGHRREADHPRAPHDVAVPVSDPAERELASGV
jgi:hypothetical protein